MTMMIEMVMAMREMMATYTLPSSVDKDKAKDKDKDLHFAQP